MSARHCSFAAFLGLGFVMIGCAGSGQGWSMLDAKATSEPVGKQYLRSTFPTPIPIRSIGAVADGLVLIHPGRAVFNRVEFEADKLRYRSTIRIEGPPPLGPVATTGDGDFWYVGTDHGSVYRVTPEGRISAEVTPASDRSFPPRLTALSWDKTRRRLWAVDTANHRVYAWDPSARPQLVLDLGGRGTGAGEFNFPTDIAVEPDGSVLILDTLNGRVQRRRQDGTFEIVLAMEDALFDRPTAIAVDAQDRIWVYDSYGGLVRGFDRRGRPLLDERDRPLALAAPEGCSSLITDDRGRPWLADPLGGSLTLFTRRIPNREVAP